MNFRLYFSLTGFSSTGQKLAIWVEKNQHKIEKFSLTLRFTSLSKIQRETGSSFFFFFFFFNNLSFFAYFISLKQKEKILNNVLQLICRSHTKMRQTKPKNLKKGLKFNMGWLCSQPFNYLQLPEDQPNSLWYSHQMFHLYAPCNYPLGICVLYSYFVNILLGLGRLKKWQNCKIKYTFVYPNTNLNHPLFTLLESLK